MLFKTDIAIFFSQNRYDTLVYYAALASTINEEENYILKMYSCTLDASINVETQ